MKEPDHRDLKVVFKVSEPNTSDRIVINTAEITDDRDENNKPVEDRDSTPGNNRPKEDDIRAKDHAESIQKRSKNWEKRFHPDRNGKWPSSSLWLC